MRKRRVAEANLSAYRAPAVDGMGARSAATAAAASHEGGARRAIIVFGKVLSSLPASFQHVSVTDEFIYRQYQQQYQQQYKKDRLREFGAAPGEESGPSAMSYARKAERFILRSFDLLRMTQNLARGDLEASAAH